MCVKKFSLFDKVEIILQEDFLVSELLDLRIILGLDV